MRRKMLIAAITAAMLCGTGMTALAGQWQSDETGKWYQEEDESFPQNTWKEIDGKWYYFGEGGYMAANQWISGTYYVGEDGAMLVNTTTPDGFEVDENGAWKQGGPGGGTSSDEGWSGGSSYSNNDWYSSYDGYSINDWYSDDSWWFGDYTYDPLWYEKDETLSEGDKAAYHYANVYQQWSRDKYNNTEYYNRINEQIERIAANPSGETAAPEMAWVEIPVWRLRGGQKVPDTTRVQVLSSIADEVKAIFTEIYNGPEQFPIESIGGYSWRSNGLSSNHSIGLAIDINPDQNPQVAADGTVLVGSKWEPGVNPYSIGRDSDVLKAFGKYGWTWGASFSRKDYMHFDFN